MIPFIILYLILLLHSDLNRSNYVSAFKIVKEVHRVCQYKGITTLGTTFRLNAIPSELTVRNPSTYYHLVNIFGRLAEHKALGFTSSYRVR
jgi:hypothetical protein